MIEITSAGLLGHKKTYNGDNMEKEWEKRFAELFSRYDTRQTWMFTNFLDLAAQDALVRSLPSLPRVPYTLYGGADGCERVMLRLGSAEECGYEQRFPISCIQIKPANIRFAEHLTHRDVLGALMSLGFERELLGDIIVREESSYLFCVERISQFVTDSLTQIRRTDVRCSVLEQLPQGELFHLQRMVVQLASVRIDALIAHVFKLSRTQAQALITAGRVFVNGRACLDHGYTPKADEVISTRGYGRMRYIGVENMSKKGKANTAVALYI